MKQHRSAQGKMVDMNTLIAKNEKTRAVGNMKVNARGDTIDGNGRVLVPVTQKVGEKYQQTVGNKSAQPTKQKPQAPTKVPASDLTKDELDIEASLDDDLEVEQIKARETKK